ncbi:MAG: helix-turn-helix domain-containing protein [Sphingobacteriaceae bacterium]|nr:helix-turn-helix domain-containing protein [Sphingobacteriaceae bacterium]
MMRIGNEILFFLSALGAFNSTILSVYFIFFKKNRAISDVFLGGLLFALSIRIGKSVFFYFNPQLSKTYLQIGLSACFLIGPFLYFFVKSKLQKLNYSFAKYSIFFLIALISVFGILFPYTENTELWRGIIYRIINIQWLIFILLSIYHAKSIFKKTITNRSKINHDEIWILSIICSVLIIWLSYFFAKYTSYISGSLSFSFSFYVLFVVLYRINSKKLTLVKEKYTNKIDEKLAKEMQEKINLLFGTKKSYTNPNLTLPILAKELTVRPHLLSQYINDNLNKSFSQFINEYRVEEAKKLLKNNDQLKIDAVGMECGFNSSSTFYSTFKKITGTTPANYQKS